MATKSRRAELEATFQKILRDRNEKIAAIRARSGMSMDELAKAMGYAGQSSIQRYLMPDYDKGFRPEVARRFRKALLGKGHPPITDEDLQVFLDWKIQEPGDPAFERHAAVKGYFDKVHDLKPSFDSGRMAAALPTAEGDVAVEMPMRLSPRSAEAVRAWLTHLIDLAEKRTEMDGVIESLADKPKKLWNPK